MDASPRSSGKNHLTSPVAPPAPHRSQPLLPAVSPPARGQAYLNVAHILNACDLLHQPQAAGIVVVCCLRAARMVPLAQLVKGRVGDAVPSLDGQLNDDRLQAAVQAGLAAQAAHSPHEYQHKTQPDRPAPTARC